MTRKQANALLPEGPSLEARINPASLQMMLIAQPKWGKTKFFMSNPDAILFAFEPGHRFQRGHKIEIVSWKDKHHDIEKDSEGVPLMTLMQAIDVICATDRYNMVILDTVDMMAKMCMDYHLDLKGIEHASDMEWGKGWDLSLNTPMRKAMLKITKTGRGVAFITHTKVEIARYTSGEKARNESTLPKGVRAFVESQADVILHGELGKTQKGQRLRDRILVCEGDMDTLAGNRTEAMLPSRYIVSKTNPWEQFSRFFKNGKSADKAELDYRKLYKRK